MNQPRRSTRWLGGATCLAAGFVIWTSCLGVAAQGESCSNDSDCASGLLCDAPGGFVGCGIPPLEQCTSSDQCDVGLVCHRVADTCSDDGIGEECGEPCDDDAACDDGFRCGAEGACEVIACEEGTCDPHLQCEPAAPGERGCVEIACNSDSFCPEGTFCVNQVCRPGEGVCQPPVEAPP
jgi:hypothetical protein